MMRGRRPLLATLLLPVWLPLLLWGDPGSEFSACRASRVMIRGLWPSLLAGESETDTEYDEPSRAPNVNRLVDRPWLLGVWTGERWTESAASKASNVIRRGLWSLLLLLLVVLPRGEPCTDSAASRASSVMIRGRPSLLALLALWLRLLRLLLRLVLRLVLWPLPDVRRLRVLLLWRSLSSSLVPEMSGVVSGVRERRRTGAAAARVATALGAAAVDTRAAGMAVRADVRAVGAVASGRLPACADTRPAAGLWPASTEADPSLMLPSSSYVSPLTSMDELCCCCCRCAAWPRPLTMLVRAPEAGALPGAWPAPLPGRAAAPALAPCLLPGPAGWDLAVCSMMSSLPELPAPSPSSSENSMLKDSTLGSARPFCRATVEREDS